jgi:para-nitrobenzyl esterase
MRGLRLVLSFVFVSFLCADNAFAQTRIGRSIDQMCLSECRVDCSPLRECRGFSGAALGACLRQCRAECREECTRLPPADSATTVNIASCGGSVFAQGFIGDFPQQGAATGQMRQFLGVPYAAAPVGANRWNPPQPFCWAGTRQFTAFGNHCASPDSIVGNRNFNEDCLFLNIFTPVNVDVDHPVPVMFWIHGGAFQFGESEAYNPIRLVDAGVIVVTINYRLGALGFLAHPALDNPSTRNTGNYGIQDQQAALAWVKQNISAFAGDPDRVTIFGESAGGFSVLYHLASQGSVRLFSRAIIQSGADAIKPQPMLRDAEALGQKFASAVGCGSSSAPADAVCLRDKSVLDILTNQNVLNWPPLSLGPSANVDGVVLTKNVRDALQSGMFNRGVPIINGSNHDEGRFFIPQTPQLGMLGHDGSFIDNLVPQELPGAVSYRNALALVFPDHPDFVTRVMTEYPGGSTDASANAALAAVVTDLHFACPAVAVDALAAAAYPVYAYEFSDATAPPNYLGPITMRDNTNFPFAAAHTAEIQYIFPMSNPSPVGFHLAQIPLNQNQLELAATMVNYWTKFAATGNPSPGSSDQWPSFAVSGQWRSLGTPHKLTSTFDSDHHCRFWDLHP